MKAKVYETKLGKVVFMHQRLGGYEFCTINERVTGDIRVNFMGEPSFFIRIDNKLYVRHTELEDVESGIQIVLDRIEEYEG